MDLDGETEIGRSAKRRMAVGAPLLAVPVDCNAVLGPAFVFSDVAEDASHYKRSELRSGSPHNGRATAQSRVYGQGPEATSHALCRLQSPLDPNS